jgi:hypothetical protein
MTVPHSEVCFDPGMLHQHDSDRDTLNSDVATHPTSFMRIYADHSRRKFPRPSELRECESCLRACEVKYGPEGMVRLVSV